MEEIRENLLEVLSTIETSSVSRLKFGRNVGSIFSLDFSIGASLMVYCSWRITTRDKIITSWRGTDGNNVKMFKGLSLLEDKRDYDTCWVLRHQNQVFSVTNENECVLELDL